MTSLTLTKQEAKTLSAQKNVAFAEEDVVVKASHAGEKTIHKKRKKAIKIVSGLRSPTPG